MRPSNKQRSRNKTNNNHNQRRNVGNIINRVFESAGPDGKVRGTPQQIIDKYQALARDAQVSGDRVAAESFLQHSEHYSRMLGEAQRQLAEQRVGQERDDASPRFDGQRSEGGGNPRAEDTGPQPAHEHVADSAPADYAPSSAMATIDPVASDDVGGGLIDTPEGRARTTAPAPAPVIEPDPQPEPAAPAAATVTEANGHGTDVPAEAPKKAPARRGRPRRTAKAEDVIAPPSAE